MASTVERYVFVYLPGAVEAVPAGRLTLLEEGYQTLGSRFAYGRRYLRRPHALPVDPFSLPLDKGDAETERAPENGLALFGALRDVTPDAWGRRVIENRLRAPPNSLPESVYLEHAGPHRAGALDVRASPTSPPAAGALPPLLDLDYLIDAAERIENGEPVPAQLEALFAGGPSVGGARPKAVLMDGGRQWIAKFPSRDDRFDVPLIEYATLQLARSAGLDVPATRLHTLADGRHVMLIERFDRVAVPEGIARRHLISALTLLGRHESTSPDASYAEISHALAQWGARGHVASDNAELFARMVFNILVSNNDDHLRNHAFLHDEANGGWRLSPLYDVVPKPQVAMERYLHLGVGPQGRAARLDNALDGAGQFGLHPPTAADIIDRVMMVVRGWREAFEAAGVPVTECDKVAAAFRHADDIGMREVARLLR
jgi:serine/threonine-protein kinase HipA